MSKYFVVNDLETAQNIYMLSDTPYYKFNEGDSIKYTFLKSREVKMAYKLIKKYKKLGLDKVEIKG